MKPHKSTTLKTLKGVLNINDLTYEYFAEKHVFKHPTVIGKQMITQTINNPAPGAETREIMKEYIFARVTASEKAALNKG